MSSRILPCAALLLIFITAVLCEHLMDLSNNANDGIALARFEGFEEQPSILRHPSINSNFNPAQVRSKDGEKDKAFLSTLRRHKRKSRQYGSTDIFGRGHRVRPTPAEPVPLSM
ncbi:unnamed protein product [Orchesella dallaii]|uniref:Uncharacterized protein n=1 Tax=Orchesella dallaii TaxID=48710 RepID=A0ABP1QVR6_9HEXA